MYLGAYIGLLDVFTEPIAHPFPSFPLPICRSADLAGGEEHSFWNTWLSFSFSLKLCILRRWLLLLFIYLHGIAFFWNGSEMNVTHCLLVAFVSQVACDFDTYELTRSIVVYLSFCTCYTYYMLISFVEWLPGLWVCLQYLFTMWMLLYFSCP